MTDFNLRDSLSKLSTEGWTVSLEAVAQYLQEQAEAEDDQRPNDLRSLLLSADLKEIGDRALPAEINSIESQPLKGPHILQVVSAEDITKAPKGGGAGGKHRVLKVKLTDGKTSCKALEIRPAPALDLAHLAPGTKVKLNSASIRMGLVLVDSKSIHVLGGRVDALAEPWEFQQKYGALHRDAEKQDPAADKPPPFTKFVPGKTRALHKDVLADIYTGTVTDQAAAAAKAEGGPSTSGMPAGAGQAEQQGSAQAKETGRRAVPIDAGGEVSALQQARETGAAKQRLLAKLAEDESASEGRGRGGRRGRGRGRRRRGHDDDEDDGTAMTLDEWEAQQKSQSRPGVQQSDEELARQLQAQMDLEDGPLPPGMEFAARRDREYTSQQRIHEQPPASHSVVDDLRRNMFSFDRGEEEHDGGGAHRGRGRGRSRGGRGTGRSRGGRRGR